MTQLTPEQQALLEEIRRTTTLPPGTKPRFLAAAERLAAKHGCTVEEVLAADIDALNESARWDE